MALILILLNLYKRPTITEGEMDVLLEDILNSPNRTIFLYGVIEKVTCKIHRK